MSEGKVGVPPRASGGLPALINGVGRSTCNALTFLCETTLVGISGNCRSGVSGVVGDWGACTGSEGGNSCGDASSGVFTTAVGSRSVAEEGVVDGRDERRKGVSSDFLLRVGVG